MSREQAYSFTLELDILPFLSSAKSEIYRCTGGIAIWNYLDLL